MPRVVAKFSGLVGDSLTWSLSLVGKCLKWSLSLVGGCLTWSPSLVGESLTWSLNLRLLVPAATLHHIYIYLPHPSLLDCPPPSPYIFIYISVLNTHWVAKFSG